MSGDDAIAVMQSVLGRAEARQQQVDATQLKLALTVALDALRTAKGSNGDSAAKITRARRTITEALKAA